jgi:integrase
MKSKKDDDGGADGQGKSSRAAPSKQGKSVPREGKGAPATEEEARQEPVWESKGGGLYMHGPTGVYYERPWVETSGGRKRTFRSLGTCNERQALGLLNQRRGRAIEARLGKGKDPYAKKKDMRLKFVSEVLKKYAAAGYPDRFLHPRDNAKTLDGEKRNTEQLLGFFDGYSIEELDQALCDDYHKLRCGEVKRGNGNRTVELELNTLSNGLNWAFRKKLIEGNPISKRARYRQAKDIRHCREFMPQDAEELHTIVRFMFGKKKSQVLGFQALCEAYTGLRTQEVLKLRVDAPPRSPGWISPDGKHLHVWRLKNQHQNNPYVVIRPGLRDALNALFRWKAEHYPISPWFFPSPYDPQKTVDESSLVHKLGDYGSALAEMAARISKEQGTEAASQTLIFTSHGLRAWYVTVRRSCDISDAQIAYEIGHSSGGGTLAEVYGGVPPSWREEGGPKMAWLPAEPAWRMFWKEDVVVIPALAPKQAPSPAEED